MRVLVCGSRDYDDREAVFAALDDVKPAHIIEGGAKGADRLAQYWAKKNLPKENLHTFEADWKGRGKAAGPIRNQQMIDEGKPDLVLAFPGGHGTADMVRRAKRAGVEVLTPLTPEKE